MADIRTSNLNPGVQRPSSNRPQGYSVPQPSAGAPQGNPYEGLQGNRGARQESSDEGLQGSRGNQGHQQYPGNSNNRSGNPGMKKQAPGRPDPPRQYDQYKQYPKPQGQNTPQYPPSTAEAQKYSTPQYNVPQPATQQYPNSAPQQNSTYNPPRSSQQHQPNSEMPRNPNAKPVAVAQPDSRRQSGHTQPGNFTDISAQPNGTPTRNSDILNGYNPRNSSISVTSDRSSTALNPDGSDNDEPRSTLGQILHFLDTEYSFMNSYPASLNTWISFWILPFSFVIYITAFSTVGWAEVDSRIIEGSPVNRKLGLWQLCHNISGCSAIDSGDIGGSSGYRAAQTFSVFSLLALFCTVISYSCYIFFARLHKTTSMGYFALGTRIATVLFLLLTFAIYSDNWYKPAFVGGSYTRYLRYSHSLCIVAWVTELVALIFISLEVYNRQHEMLHITSLKQLEELASKQAADEDLKRSSRGQNGWEEMPDRPARGQNGWEEMPDRSSQGQNGWEEMPDRSSRGQNGWEELPDRSSRGQNGWEEMPDRSSRGQNGWEEMPDKPRGQSAPRGQEQSALNDQESNPLPQAPQRKIQGRRSMKKAAETQNQNQDRGPSYTTPQPQNSRTNAAHISNPTYSQPQPQSAAYRNPTYQKAPQSQSTYTMPQPSYSGSGSQGQGSRSSGSQVQGSRSSGVNYGATNPGLDV